MMREGRAAVQAAALALGLALSLGPVGSGLARAAAQSGVIPLPAEIIPRAGSFSVSSATVVRVPSGDRDAAAAAAYFVELLTRSRGLTLPVTAATSALRTGSSDAITFRRQTGLGPEAYRLEVAPRGIVVSATTATGLFYGAVTL